MRTWKSVELEKAKADKLRKFLKGKGIRYEASECYNLIHFEILCNGDEVKEINAVLERM